LRFVRHGTSLAAGRDAAWCGEEARMKILIGVDGSDFSKAAIEHVCRQTWPAGSEVVVVSAVAQPVIPSPELYVAAATTATAILEAERRSHEEFVSKAEAEFRRAGLTARGRVMDGDAREALVRAAREEGAQLLVVGSHGRTGLAKLLLGSVASHVVSHAPCNVLVVRPGQKQ
jgi:nucleotide-binding universal stress UspA family protein